MNCASVAEEASSDPALDIDSFFDVSLDLLIVRDMTGRVVKASASWFSTLGWTPAEIEGQGLMRLVHPEDLDRTLAAAREVEVRRPGDPVLETINRYRHRNGGYISLEWRARRQGDRIYAIARDVTEKLAQEQALRDAKAAAEAASQAKSDFLANMSHEIRTPLNGVIGIVEALERTTLAPCQREMVELIRNSGVTLERLVSDILDVSKIEAGRLHLERRPFDLEEALAVPLEVMRVKARDKGLAFVVDRDPEARGLFLGDSTRIRQIVSNLLSNAVKFTEAGQVAVRIALDEDQDGLTQLTLAVRDTGVGFDPATAAHLFDRFSQADATITRRFGGTGLGLSICGSLIEMMGGRIAAVSAPGAGSCFTVALPLARTATLSDYEAAERARAKNAAAATDRPLRILLAEDHPTNQRVIQLILADQDVELVTVADGLQALEAFRSEAFDLVLMDMQMPQMDGLSATRAIRSLESERGGERRTPVVMLTANAMAAHREQAHAAGADLHLTKPITANALIGGIQSALAA